MAATAGLVTTGLAAAFGAALAAAFDAAVLATVAFAAGLAADLCCISLLFLEDFAAETAFLAVRVFLRDARVRLLVALRLLAAAAFLVVLEALVLRVFCDTACARNCHAPVRMFSTGTQKGQAG